MNKNATSEPHKVEPREVPTFIWYLRDLTKAAIVGRPESESWPHVTERINQPGVVHEIDEETYDYFLEVLPPLFVYNGFMFGYAEGYTPLRLFWKSDKAFFCRQLDDDETRTFAKLVHAWPEYKERKS